MKTTCFDRILDYLTHNTTIDGEYFEKREYCSAYEYCPKGCSIDDIIDLLSLMIEFEEDESDTIRFDSDFHAFLPDVINPHAVNCFM